MNASAAAFHLSAKKASRVLYLSQAQTRLFVQTARNHTTHPLQATCNEHLSQSHLGRPDTV